MHVIHAAIGNRAAREQRELRGAARRREHVALAIPDQARSQLGELGGRVAAGEHVEHRDQRVARQIAEVRGAPQRALQLVDLPRRDAHHRDDLLRQHVERIARDRRRLDGALFHAAAHDGGFEQVAAVLRIDAPLRDLADLMSRAADPLQAARDGAGRFDEQHQIDGAHVDAEFETRRRDDAANPSCLQRLLDLAPLLVRDAAVVREQDLFAREFVESLAESLAEAARVDEEDRRAVREHLLQQVRVDRGPEPERRIRRFVRC